MRLLAYYIRLGLFGVKVLHVECQGISPHSTLAFKVSSSRCYMSLDIQTCSYTTTKLAKPRVENIMVMICDPLASLSSYPEPSAGHQLEMTTNQKR